MSMSSETHSHDANGAPEPVLSQQTEGKRAACDRCRGQKLRCLRQAPGRTTEPGKCVRCSTAGAICCFSASKRAGRRPNSSNVKPTDRKLKGKFPPRGQAATTERESLENETSNEDMYEDQQEDDDTDQPMEGTFNSEDEVKAEQTNLGDVFIPQPLITSFMNDTNWGPVADIPWIDECMAAPYDPDSVTTSTGLDSFIQDYNWSLPTGSPTSQFSHTQMPNFAANLMAENVKAHDELVPSSSTSTFGQKVLDPQTISTGAESADEPLTINMIDARPMAMDNSNTIGETTSDPVGFNKDVHHRRMQELSELGMSLYSQVVSNEEYQQTQSSASSVPCEQFVGDMLKSSATFLKLLGSFYPSSVSQESPSKASAWSSGDEEISPSEVSIFSDYSDVATNTSTTTATTASSDRRQTYQWRPSGSTVSLPSLYGNVNQSREDAKPSVTDMTTILQLLTCYIRIIHLHSIFYTQIHDCLTSRPNKRGNQLSPVFPGMQIGDLCLDGFPNFQIKLLLQISTHLLGEIEKALGLPEGYRISIRDPQSQGILEASVSVQFVEMTMRENMRTGLMGIEKDRIQSIREKLGSLRCLLKGTINI